MSDTKQEQNKSEKPTITANDTHDNCGTPECCGECETAEITEEQSVTAYGHVKSKIDDR